ncbi:MAG TPA: PBP1A family penicillin-binding protein [Myxococcaceae bacterium]|nr:PBP1A family penicillin-binding protein [Myxococcaceae bacterium]
MTPEPEESSAPRTGFKLVLGGVAPPRGWKKRAAIIAAWAALTGGTAMVVVFAGLYYRFSRGLPDIPSVEEYRPPIITEVFTDDAVLAGEFYNERRKVVPYEQIPKRLVQAFIASEDANFFDHMGIDLLGTARAAFKTLLKKASGSASVQGGSTLTQQTAKAVLVSAEGYRTGTQKSITRKIREAILALRLERQLTKEEILYLYLNNVYLGHHSYGVKAAAENYYRKDVRDLTLAEMALVAGLPQAPSGYSPFLNPEAAKKRRTYVLRRMLEEGMISKAEHDAAKGEEVRVYPVEDVFHEFAPYFVEQVRKDVVGRYGNPTLLNEGLHVFTTMDSERQRAAQEAVLRDLLAVDKRQGFRGPLLQLGTAPERDAFVEKSKKAMAGHTIEEGKFYVALVTAIESDGLSADVQIGAEKGKLPLLGMRWARKVNPEGYYPSTFISSINRALQIGDVVVVRAVAAKDLTDDKEQRVAKLAEALPKDVTLFRLEQEPELQGALVSIDPHRQYLVSMVGGYDFDANEYNRAFQACRQPGSAYKPIVYSAAIENLGWTEATPIVDSPVVFDDPDTQRRWKPENYNAEGFKGDVLLRTAIVHSMNIPAVKTFQAVGVPTMAEWAKKLGISTPMNQDFSSALGSSCVYPFELAGLYATLNRGGEKKKTYYLRKVEDRFGRTLEDHTAYDDPWAPLQDRIAAGYARLFERSEQVMSPETGYILVDLLRGVVREGTGAPAQRLGKPAAGKTGTTNDSFDAWFAGFTRDLVAVSWVGYDLNQHPLGRFENGGRAALPMWLAYMKQALLTRPQPEFEPDPNLDLIKLSVDTRTGKLASGASRFVAEMWFKRGTEPQEKQPEKNQPDPKSFLQLPN